MCLLILVKLDEKVGIFYKILPTYHIASSPPHPPSMQQLAGTPELSAFVNMTTIHEFLYVLTLPDRSSIRSCLLTLPLRVTSACVLYAFTERVLMCLCLHYQSHTVISLLTIFSSNDSITRSLPHSLVLFSTDRVSCQKLKLILTQFFSHSILFFCSSYSLSPPFFSCFISDLQLLKGEEVLLTFSCPAMEREEWLESFRVLKQLALPCSSVGQNSPTQPGQGKAVGREGGGIRGRCLILPVSPRTWPWGHCMGVGVYV